MQEIITVLLSLALIIGLIFLTLYITKHVMKKFNFSMSKKGGLRVIDCVGVGQDKTVAVVKAGNKNFLLGVTNGGINLISELDDEDLSLIEGITTQDTTNIANGNGMSFAEALKATISEKFGGKNEDKKDGIK